jgi:hypothetical protein
VAEAVEAVITKFTMTTTTTTTIITTMPKSQIANCSVTLKTYNFH